MENKFSSTVTLINKLKNWFSWPMWWIFRYIKESDCLLNTNFFLENININQQIINEKISIFNERINKIKNIKEEIENFEISKIEKKFLINALDILELKFELFKESIYLEAEKAWFELSNNDRKIFLDEVNRIQDLIYGPEISSVESEKAEILNLLSNIFKENKCKISEDEAKYFNKFLWNFDYKKIDLIKNKDNDNFTNKFLPKEKVIKIFETVINIYDLDWWVISLENVDNFSVKKDDKKILIPEWKIEKISLKRILQLIDHEIWVHWIRWFNSDLTLKTNWEWYLEWEEWKATLTELLFDNKLEEVSVLPTIHHISTFIAENYNFEDTKKILEIYYKLTWLDWDRAIIEANDKTIRVKRFVSLYEKWANRKDVSYTRWQKEVVEYLQNASIEGIKNFIKDFYFSKLSLNDISLVPEFKKNIKYDESKLKYPLWIWQILYKKLLWRKIFLENNSSSFNHWENKMVLQEQPLFSHVEELTFGTKRKIVEILKLAREKYSE